MNRDHPTTNFLDFDTRAREARAVAMREMWTTLRARLVTPSSKADRG